MRSCDKITRLLSDGMERPLTWMERIEIKIHISMCTLCRSYEHNVRRLHDILSYMREHDANRSSGLSKSNQARLKAGLKAQIDADGRSPSD